MNSERSEAYGRVVKTLEDAGAMEYTVVVVALNTGMRETEIRTLRWDQVDFDARTIRVGKSKTAAGTGRVIPMKSVWGSSRGAAPRLIKVARLRRSQLRQRNRHQRSNRLPARTSAAPAFAS